LVARAIEREYGGNVSMQYVELATPEARETHKDIIQLTRKRYLRFPLVMIEDELLYHGSLDYYSLSAAIKARLSESGGTVNE
jgi:disulfide oxidoreductase YuzD